MDRRILERDTCGQENLRESYVWAGNEGAIWVKSVGEEGLKEDSERDMCAQEVWVQYG